MSFIQGLIIRYAYYFVLFEFGVNFIFKIVNTYVLDPNLINKINKTVDVLKSAVNWLGKFEKHCPKFLVPTYKKIVDAIKFLLDCLTLKDSSKIDIQNAIDKFKSAYSEWNSRINIV